MRWGWARSSGPPRWPSHWPTTPFSVALRGAGRWVSRLSGALLVLAGAYVAWYGWWEIRVLSGSLQGDDPVIAAAAGLQRSLAEGAAAVGPGGWALVVLALLVLAGSRRWLRRRSQRVS